MRSSFRFRHHLRPHFRFRLSHRHRLILRHRLRLRFRFRFRLSYHPRSFDKKHYNTLLEN